ncbi:RHS repeat-associated core domain-containing protein [Xanthocytophaga agilis]|uniref:RHS repeat-associated core domain-containing protein n=1 Tax=Xanthocytophaga agilis TaxID=3048010 RepID=A0AAE3RBL9_9BACT|nr:RHS repeat-associated core domain-containing protein [Xanthocytophaga agilis]MDJ1505179.1 RHS repeat-associated core domain-containing protein [Xanthocytophaga agilis]
MQSPIVQENHYDPWGLNLVGIEKQGSPNHKFQYNGKEKQEEFGLNWIDYGYRNYDSQLGRWHSIDKFTEKYNLLSPYQYTLNNPMSTVDIQGDSVYVVINGQIKLISEKHLEILERMREKLMKTEDGKKLMEHYEASKTSDIYITVQPFNDRINSSGSTIYYGAIKPFKMIDKKGVIDLSWAVLNKPNQGSMDHITLSGIKVKNPLNKISFVSINQDYLENKGQWAKYSIYDKAFTLWHEIKAHIDLGGGSAADDHAVLGVEKAGIDQKAAAGTPAESMILQLKNLRFLENLQQSLPAQFNEKLPQQNKADNTKTGQGTGF